MCSSSRLPHLKYELQQFSGSQYLEITFDLHFFSMSSYRVCSNNESQTSRYLRYFDMQWEPWDYYRILITDPPTFIGYIPSRAARAAVLTDTVILHAALLRKVSRAPTHRLTIFVFLLALCFPPHVAPGPRTLTGSLLPRGLPSCCFFFSDYFHSDPWEWLLPLLTGACPYHPLQQQFLPFLY